jgi:alkylation response protein AidB-like acyl-CoA dehydrogenase
MDFSLPIEIIEEIERFKRFVETDLAADLKTWYRSRELPRTLFEKLGAGGWYGIRFENGRLAESSALREALLTAELARKSPGAAVAALAHADLGLMGVLKYASASLHARYGMAAVSGRTVMCLANTENRAGSDAAAVQMKAQKTTGGWVLDGTKAYVTNGALADMAIVTAVTDPKKERNRRHSMFLVDLSQAQVQRRRLDKQVWIPSELTRLDFKGVMVPEDHLLGKRGHGLQQVLSVFTRSRVPIAALSLATAEGAFDLALKHSRRRKIFGRRISDFQAKAFESADLYARIEAARMMLWRACWQLDRGEDYRKESSLAKYLAVEIAKAAAAWSADLFGAAAVVFEHPAHKFPMDAWAASLGEGTQDVQKLIIFREMMKAKTLEHL